MSDVLRMQLDIQNNLEKDLEKSTKKMKGFNSLIEDAADKFKNIGKNITKFVIGGLKSMGRIISQIIPGFAALFSVSTIIDAVRSVLEMNKSLTQLSFRMGHGAQGAKVLQETVYSVNAELGIGVKNSEELVSTLTTMRVPLDMMRDMTRTTGLFSELTGLSADRSAELGGNLVRVGRMGQEAVDGIMASMVGVQRAVGLTESEMNSLSDTIGSSTQMLNQMGKSAGEIEKYNRGIVKLSAAFASVGVEAEKVLSIMDDLLDPGEVEKHAYLLSQLGVSLGDAFEGNIDPAQLVSGFRDLGQTLSGMTGPAAAAMADQLGMSVRDLRQMAELGDEELASVANAMADGASGAEAMASAFKEEATGMQKFERAMERIKGFIGETAMKFMPVIDSMFSWVAENSEVIRGHISTAIEWFMKLPNIVKMAVPLLIGGILLFFKFMRKRFATTATDASKSLETGVAEGIKQGSRKGALAMRQEFASAKEIDLRIRTEQGAGFRGMIADAELLEARAQGMEGFFGDVMRKTAAIHRNLAYSTKPVSYLEAKSIAMAKNNEQAYEAAKNQTAQITAAFETREQQNLTEEQRLERRIKYLQEYGNVEASMIDRLEAKRKRLENNRLKDNNKLEDTTRDSVRRQERAMKAMSDNTLIDIGLEKKSRQDALQSSISGIVRREQAALKEQEALNAAMRDLQNRYDEMPLHDFQQKQKEITAAITEQETIQRQLATQREQEIAEVGTLKKEYEKINTVLSEDRGINEISESAKALSEEGGHFSRFIIQAGRNLKKSVGDTVQDFTEGARNAAGAFADRFRKENIGATLRSGARKGVSAVGRGTAAAGRGIASAGGGIMKVLGPIGLLVGVLTRLEPVQEMMSEVMEKLRIPLQNLAERLMPIIRTAIDMLMPIIDSLIDALMPVVDILVESLVPIISRILGVLGPLFNTIVKALGPVLESVFSALMPLIDMILPALIWVLGTLVEATGRAVGIIGNVLKFLMELPGRIKNAITPLSGEYEASAELQANSVYAMVDSIATMGNDLAQAGRDMRQSAFNPTDPDIASAFTESIAEGTARGNAQAEIRRTWEPAQLRALRDGIQQEQAMTEVISGGSNEDRIANNSDRQLELQEQEILEQRRANDLLERQIQMQEQNHEEDIATARRQQARTGMIAASM